MSFCPPRRQPRKMDLEEQQRGLQHEEVSWEAPGC